jgi:hypothetical protein
MNLNNWLYERSRTGKAILQNTVDKGGGNLILIATIRLSELKDVEEWLGTQFL